MKHRKGMRIFRLTSDWGEVIEGDANDLEALGFDSSMVRMAVATQNPYRGYICTVAGIREASETVVKPKKKIGVEEFNNIAISEGKNYAQLQLEETMGRVIKC